MSVLNNNMFGAAVIANAADAADDDPYIIEKSLRLNGTEDSTSLTRESIETGYPHKRTVSFWVKKVKWDEYFTVQDAYASSGWLGTMDPCNLRMENDGEFYFETQGSYKDWNTYLKHRDEQAWYHFVCVYDTGNEIDADMRQVLYINGRRIPKEFFKDTVDFTHWDPHSFLHHSGMGGGYPASTIGTNFNNSIGYSNGYLADYHFIDGHVLSAASFGEYDSTGNWQPKAWSVPIYNDGTTWSGKLSANSGGFHSSHPATYAFNGSLSNKAGENVNGATSSTNGIVFKPDVGGVSYGAWSNVISFRYYGEAAGAHMKFRFHDGSSWGEWNEVKGTYWDGANTSWRDCSEQLPLNHKFAGFELTARSGGHAFLGAIEINGVILQDGVTDKNYADYKASDPNDGTKWSDYFTAGGNGFGTSTTGGPAYQAFDGGESTGASHSANSIDNTLTFAPPERFTGVTKLEIYTDHHTTQTELRFNSGTNASPSWSSWVTGSTQTGWNDFTSHLSGGNFAAVETKQTVSNGAAFRGIKINGYWLVDNRNPHTGGSSFILKFNETGALYKIGKDSLNGKIADSDGGLPFYKTDDYGDVKDSSDFYRSDSSALDGDGVGLVLALPGDVLTDEHNHVNVSSSEKGMSNTNCVLRTDHARFYGSSIYLNGVDAKLTTTADASDFDLSGGTFTVETWFMSREKSATSKTIFVNKETGTSPQIVLGVNNSQLFGYTGTTQIFNASTANQIPVNGWCHIAVTRDGTTWRLFINGVLTEKKDNAVSGTSDGFYLGYASEAGATPSTRWLKGNYNDVRVYKTVCKYTTNFKTPHRNDWFPNNLDNVASATPKFQYFKFRSSYNSTGYSCAYSIEYSDNNSSWTEAWNGIATTAGGACQLIQGTNGGGDYGAHRYWRFKCGATNNSTHFPRVSRLVLTDSNGVDHELVKFVDDNCSDSGTIPALNSTYARDFKMIGGDQCILNDSPTNSGEDTGAGGEVTGNFCHFTGIQKESASLVSNRASGLRAQSTSDASARAHFANEKYKFYYEATVRAGPGACTIGIISTKFAADQFTEDPMEYRIDNGEIYGGSGSHPGTTFTIGDTLGVAVDKESGTNTIAWYKNGSLIQSRSMNAECAADPVHPIVRTQSTSSIDFNFGQRPFRDNAPSGYKSWCTQNLNDTFADGDNVNNPSAYFKPVKYVGTNLTQTVDGLPFKPDLVWIKNRTDGGHHSVLVDAIRGVGWNLNPSNPDAQDEGADITAFTDSGFTLATGNNEMHDSGEKFIAWCWNFGTAGDAQTDGSINVSSPDQWAVDEAGQSLTRYTADSSYSSTIGHGLSAAPEVVYNKSLPNSADFELGTTTIDGSMDQLKPSATTAKADAGTAPTADVFYNPWGNNDASWTWCMRHVEGYFRTGSYTGNNSASGRMQWCGFRPSLIFIKNIDDGGAMWVSFDDARDFGNYWNWTLHQPSDSNNDSQSVGTDYIDILSNGFRPTRAHGYVNDTNKFWWMAWAAHPFKTARAR